MPTDPAAPFPLEPGARQAAAIADLQRRLSALERGAGIVTVGAGPPASTVTTRFYIDELNIRLYVRVSATMRYVGLT